MPKFKKPRIPVKIDMTPMVDVAFLLLTFFMLTTQFRPPEAVEIILPSSHSEFKLPDVNIATVTIGKDGRIFLGFDSQRLMGDKDIFGEENKLKTGVEVPMNRLQDLLQTARRKNPKLATVIKGDKEADYGYAEDVMDILKKANITRFNLVTDYIPPTKQQ
ncbi:MAG: biopolymer transporter ExbD [Ignavibacteriales bacterium CG07_land_8_20_14_0_80_59_12]|nr:MAG: biopolymer transporter ExbD [Ignavibacteriales bacterium CG07_land_8_20_14_0_80_59_12]